MSSSYVYIESPLYYEDMVGTWVDNTDPDYPTVLKIWEDNGNFYGHYSWFSPGNENGIGFANTYTEWGKWDGYLDVAYENGYLSFPQHHRPCLPPQFLQTFSTTSMNDSLVEISKPMASAIPSQRTTHLNIHCKLLRDWGRTLIA